MEKLNWIVARLTEGRTVYLTTYLRSTRFTPKHLPNLSTWLKASDGHLLMREGKAWVNADFVKISAR